MGHASRQSISAKTAAGLSARVAADRARPDLAHISFIEPTAVKLDGEIGVLGNGAGLVMSTLDLVALAGGRPANFCDLGGGGAAQGVVDALEVISADPQVKAIVFNIFGGITRCDEVARGILQALEAIAIAQPIVVRFDGTNAEEGRRLLSEAKLTNVYPEPTMLEAAKRAVELAG